MKTQKGTLTKENIMAQAFEVVSKIGLESLSIGELAKSVGMSKSGLFGHFKSKEKLQLTVIDYAADQFIHTVIRPSIKKNRGLPRIEAMRDNYVSWASKKLNGGCPILAAAIEYDDRPGAIQNKTRYLVKEMVNAFSIAANIAIEEGHFNKNTDPEQFGFEFYAHLLSFHIHKKLLNDKKSKQKLQTAISKLIEQSQ